MKLKNIMKLIYDLSHNSGNYNLNCNIYLIIVMIQLCNFMKCESK